MGNFSYNLKKFFTFSRQEVKAVFFSALVIAFIVSFRMWGPAEGQFDALYGLRSLFDSFLIAILALLVHISAQKIYGMMIGYKVDFNIYWQGLIAGLVVCFATLGYVWLIIPGGIVIHHLAVHRLGYFRYGLNYKDLGWISAMGPLANVLLAAFLAIIAFGAVIIPPMTRIGAESLIERAISLNLWMAIFTMLPIPPLDGSNIFYASRLFYAFSFGCIVGYSILVLVLGFYSLIFVLIMGAIFWLITHKIMETAG